MKNIVKKIWNSKAFETMADINYEVMKGVGAVIKGTAEVMVDVANGMLEKSAEINVQREDVAQETYDYWKSLTCVEQQEYFERNYKLQEYGEMYRYDNQEQMAKSVAEIARRENRTFCNRYDQY